MKTLLVFSVIVFQLKSYAQVVALEEKVLTDNKVISILEKKRRKL